ncbi:TRAP transporter large permease [Oceanibacterium hippocampi]|uniref:TRAP transporter large permease protein n=1 Tax=Oceanibacterium hippocampi TaxID=745714 RepID=A0A1Y5U087_9PROT|nr:TRAP transporter large permease [Oceanibacterium hippocampi]SLN75312.1 Sialic acid TRAP transporter permease protein SiaT [Oceanibacterium hippocampi]
MSGIIIGLFLVIAIFGVPLAFALGIAGFAGLVIADLPLRILAQRAMFSVNSFPLMAIPFFMLAGELMVSGGIIGRLIDFANILIGRVRGGLAQVTVGAGMGMASVSGAAIADATALTSVLYRPVAKQYNGPFAAAVIAASANLGPILPPSTAMIIYATLAPGVSVRSLFMAGVIPGLMIGVLMMLTIAIIAHRRGLPLTGDRLTLVRLVRGFWTALPVLLLPVIVIGGIVGGMFTATEGGAIAVVYSLVVGLFVTRTLKLADLPGCLLRSAITTAIIGVIIAFAATITYLFTIDLLPQRLADFALAFTDSRVIFLVFMMGALMIVGMFLEPNAAYVMLVPVLAPLASEFGVDPLHFAILFVLNMVVGLLTPPVGTLLFVVSAMTEVRIGELVRELLPFIGIQYGVMLACLFLPPLALWLPGMLS